MPNDFKQCVNILAVIAKLKVNHHLFTDQKTNWEGEAGLSGHSTGLLQNPSALPGEGLWIIKSL